MPPFGLYPVPRNHLYGGSPSIVRPSFNTRDFHDDTRAPAATMQSEVVHPVSEEAQGGNVTHRRKDKKKQKQQTEVQGRVEAEVIKKTPRTPVIVEAPMTTSSADNIEKNRKKEKAMSAKRTSAKKRKRESEGNAGVLKVPRNDMSNRTSLFGDEFLQDLKVTMGDLSASFGDPTGVAQPSKKSHKNKPSSKNERHRTKVNTTKSKANDTAGETLSSENNPKKKRGRPRKNTHTKDSGGQAKTLTQLTATPYATTPQQTPVPLPWNSPSQLARTTKRSQHKHTKANHVNTQVLATETPSSQLLKSLNATLTNPIPSNLQLSSTNTSLRKRTEKGPTIDLSPSKTESGQPPESAPTTHSYALNASSGNQFSSNNSIEGQNYLTSSNLLRYTQPLSDEPKPRPRGRAASTATSTGSSSSMSVKEGSTRVGKPYSRSGAEIDPFITPEIRKKKKIREMHEESDTRMFMEAFKASQRTVNFTDEHEYLAQYLRWRDANDAAGPLPCLNKATGCNAKREKLLRLSKQDPSLSLKAQPTAASDSALLEDANERFIKAESLLALAIPARLPVPLGPLKGVWNLHCPKYSLTHVDKYNFGQRTLTISPLAGSTSASTYTARLSLPPRSMSYTILPFEAPPHASFRPTRLSTSAEAYKLDVVFCGNGYLQLRLDLHLLLMGKPMENAGGKHVLMEFVGVHEAALRWREDEDELEETGRRLFAKYDGGIEED
ncbi:hypothetical protein BKA66DRAFT_574756 [Pyrenochaeta sp. MPI-SDFR-AT-0127]|nr:hypothetical protein BKA66DRAFT_574756 [Pyrenochaeta sp. MPI-SDFR-AT-0127]